MALCPLIHALALRAVEIAVDAPGHRPRSGTVVYRLSALLPLARGLLGVDHPPALVELPPLDSGVRVVDGRGHTRPVYRRLAWRLAARQGHAAPAPPARPGADVAERAWALLNEVDAGRRAGFPRAELPPGAGPLHPQAADDAPDHWTYRELLTLHAWYTLACDAPSAEGLARAHSAALYHQQHTQPDYTTYQPWALAAFLSRPETVPFAEQQLHDVRHHLSVEGGPGAVVAALLLADAWATTAGAR